MHKDVFGEIMNYLGPRDVCHCARVCKRWHRWAKDALCWERFKRIFPPLGTQMLKPYGRRTIMRLNNDVSLLHALFSLHFSQPIKVLDISDRKHDQLHVIVHVWDADRQRFNYERPLFIWTTKLPWGLRARYGKAFFADCPGPSVRQLFVPYEYFLQTGNQPRREHSIMCGWKFRIVV